MNEKLTNEKLIGANYITSSLLNNLILSLSDPSCTGEARKFIIEIFKNMFNDVVSVLSLIELQNIKTYMESLIEAVDGSKKYLLGLTGCESDDEEEIDAEKKAFTRRVLSDRQGQIGDLIELLDLTIEAINLGLDELKKYLPSKPSIPSDPDVGKRKIRF